jgi:hypothetical protein
MSEKPRSPKNNPPADPNSKRSQKESNKRHVYIEPGAKIDFVEDLRKKYETAQTDDNTHKTQQLLWTKIAAGLLLVTAGITWWQGCLTRESITNNTAQFQVSQRPWIEVGGKAEPIGGASVATGEQPAIYTTIENVGNTPAWEERTKDTLDLHCFPAGTKDNFLDNPADIGQLDPSKVSAAVIMPHGHHQTGGVTIGRAFTEADMNRIRDGNCVLYYYGRTNFCDIWDHQHWRTFCDQYVPETKSGFRICSKYNDGDENHSEEPKTCSR